MSYYFSPSTKSFYAAQLQSAYEASGTWPADVVAVSDEIFAEFGLAQAPAGQVRGTDSGGLPAWITAT